MRKQGLHLAFTGKKLYVTIMMETVGRALQALSQQDALVQSEVAGLPNGFIFCMRVGTGQPALMVMKDGDGTLRYLGAKAQAEPDLTISIKHIELAFRMLSFQESTSQAFANDRMIVDGDVSLAVRMVRVLNRLESIILPDVVAQLAVKRVDRLPFATKVPLALKVYAGATTAFIGDQLNHFKATVSDLSPALPLGKH